MNQRKKEEIKEKNKARREFLLETFFKNVGDHYTTTQVGKWTLVKQWDGINNRWDVAVWDTQTFNRVRQMYQEMMF